MAFSGRLSSKKKLALGRYKMTVTPTDGSGNRGKGRSANIRIVARQNSSARTSISSPSRHEPSGSRS